MRVRIRRFGWLRLRGKTRDSKSVEVGVGQGDVDRQARVVAPATGVGRNLSRREDRHASGSQLTKNGAASFPLLELQRAQAVTDPPVEVVEDARRVGQLEVALPANEVTAQFRRLL